ncbi:MAG: hypothetical protein ACTSYC_00595 [Promethearchaeota archaeon]
MNSYLPHLELKDFYLEIFWFLSKSDVELRNPWINSSEIEFLKQLDDQQRDYFLEQFPFIKKERWNHISIDKIAFILEAMEFLRKDLYSLSKLLDYHGFEELIQEILKRNGYHALRNFHFSDKSNFKNKTRQKKYEIDVIGFNNKYLLCIDAKQWQKKDSYISMNKAANLQLQRVLALQFNPNTLSVMLQDLIGISKMKRVRVPFFSIPIIVTLEHNTSRFNEKNIPLVSIFQFNAFLQELYLNLPHFYKVEIKSLTYQTQLF